MSSDVRFDTQGSGTAPGILASPDGTAGAAGLVLLQEYWGLNAHIRGLAARFADAGFLTLAPDLYDGKIATNATEAGAMMSALDRPRALAQIAGAVAFLKRHARATGKVGVVGFCLGGALTFAAGCVVPEVDALVPFYGVPPQADWSTLRAPVLAHFAAKDDWAKPELGEVIRQAIVAQGGRMELHVYDAKHAFFNDTRPEVYDAEAARLAWTRTVAFLREELA